MSQRNHPSDVTADYIRVAGRLFRLRERTVASRRGVWAGLPESVRSALASSWSMGVTAADFC